MVPVPVRMKAQTAGLRKIFEPLFDRSMTKPSVPFVYIILSGVDETKSAQIALEGYKRITGNTV